MRRKNNYKFTKKKHSKRGMVSCGFSAGSVFALFFAIFNSFLHKGEGSVYLGSLGIFAFLFAIVAIVLAIGSFREEESFRLFPRLSVLLSVLIALIWLGLFVVGTI